MTTLDWLQAYNLRRITRLAALRDDEEPDDDMLTSTERAIRNAKLQAAQKEEDGRG